MARAKTTHDVFSAIGEPKRRQIIENLAREPKSVGKLTSEMGWNQPMVSKHLGVLREVGLIKEKKAGRCRIYYIRPDKLRPIQTWIHEFEKYWGGTFDQLDEYLTKLQNSENNP